MSGAVVETKTRVCLLLLLLLLVVYSPMRHNGFVLYDDPVYVTENSYVHRGLSLVNIKWAFTTTEGGNWHPITWLSHQLDCTLFDRNPLGHHMMSLFFHWLNCSLLFCFLLKATEKKLPSFLCALCFALHPLAVDSVAWVSERKNLLSLLFWLLAIASHWNFVKRKEQRWYVGTLWFMALSLMSKPMAVTLPFSLVLLDYWPLAREESLWKLLKEKLPLLAISLLFVFLTLHVQGAEGAITSRFPLSLRIANGLVTYVRYCTVFAVPINLAVFYPHPDPWVSNIGLGLSLLALLGLSLVFTRFYKKHPYCLIGWCWFLGTLFPVIGLIQAGVAARADRHTYVPIIGLFCALVFWGSNWVRENRRAKKAAVASMTALLILWAALTWQQVHYWRDSVSLFSRAAAVTRENYVTANNLGFAYLLRGDLEKAEKWLEIAVKLDQWYAPSLDNMGLLKRKQGKPKEAELWSLRAISRSPQKAGAHSNLGMALLAQGRREAAKKSFQTALALDQGLANVHFQLGVLAAKERKMGDAITHFEKTVVLAPDFAQGHNNLGVLLAQKEDKARAISHFRQALALDGNYKEAQRNLLRALGKSQNP